MKMAWLEPYTLWLLLCYIRMMRIKRNPEGRSYWVCPWMRTRPKFETLYAILTEFFISSLAIVVFSSFCTHIYFVDIRLVFTETYFFLWFDWMDIWIKNEYYTFWNRALIGKQWCICIFICGILQIISGIYDMICHTPLILPCEPTLRQLLCVVVCVFLVDSSFL